MRSTGLRAQGMRANKVITTHDVLRPPQLFLTWGIEPQREKLKEDLGGQGQEGHGTCDGQEGPQIAVHGWSGEEMGHSLPSPTHTWLLNDKEMPITCC